MIESDSVEGIAVYGVHGKSVGEIQRLVIEKVSGKSGLRCYSFGGFLGIGNQHYTIPWGYPMIKS